MRSVLWILGMGLIACAALFYAWRLLPADARRGASPLSPPVEPAAQRQAATGLRGEAQAPVPSEVGSGADGGRLSAQAPFEPLVQPAGLEEGGQSQAGRPLPDFSAKYQGLTRASKALALRGLEESIRERRRKLNPAEQGELAARLANAPLPQTPVPRIAELLAAIDEREWLVRALAGPTTVER